MEEVLIQTINTENCRENYRDILDAVCNGMYNLLEITNSNNILEYSNNVNITITYKMKFINNPCMKEKLKHLQKYKLIKKNDQFIKNNEKCIICLQNYCIGEYKRILHCKHTLHKRFIDKWFMKSKNMECPLCKVSYCYQLLVN